MSRKAKLTKKTVEALSSEGKEYQVMDLELSGFGVRILPSGVKSYFVRYRNQDGQSRRLALGKHGELTADQARRLAQEKLAEVRNGADPSATKQKARQAPTVNELIERYMKEHVAIHNKPKTAKDKEGLIRLNIAPVIGKLKVASVKRDHIRKIHDSLSDKPRTANYTLSVLKNMFNKAEEWEIRPDHSNPCTHVKPYPEKKRDRFLDADEIHRLFRALSEAETMKTEHPQVINAIHLLLFTGCRLGEVLNLRWQDVDYENQVFNLPDSKTGARVHSVGNMTISFLQEIQKDAVSEFVCPGIKDASKPLRMDTMESRWGKLAKAANLKDVRLHDLRHTVGTWLDEIGASSFLIQHKLGHSNITTTGRYVNRNQTPLQHYSNKLESIFDGFRQGKTTAEIISLNNQKKETG